MKQQHVVKVPRCGIKIDSSRLLLLGVAVLKSFSVQYSLCDAMGSREDPLGADERGPAQVLVQGVDERHLPAPFGGLTVFAADDSGGSGGPLDTADVLAVDRVSHGTDGHFALGRWKQRRNEWIVGFQTRFILAGRDTLPMVHDVVNSALVGSSVVPFVSEAFSGFWPSASRIRLLGEQHFVPGLRHLNTSVISAFPAVTKVSNKVLLITGGPQGSNLGPFLFVVFINDLIISIDGPVLAYVDDINSSEKINNQGDGWCRINFKN